MAKQRLKGVFAERMILQWPWWQRILHWSLAGSIITALIFYEGGKAHELAGYIALASCSVRIALGLFGPKEARFKTFLASPAVTTAYAQSVINRSEPRYLNHNPLGAWMVLALFAIGLGRRAVRLAIHNRSILGRWLARRFACLFNLAFFGFSRTSFGRRNFCKSSAQRELISSYAARKKT